MVKQWKIYKKYTKYKVIKLVSNAKSYEHNVRKPMFKLGMHFNKTPMGCEMGKAMVNKPVYLGQSGLALSKSQMDELHYEYKKLKYNNNINLGYMDKYVYDINTFSY